MNFINNFSLMAPLIAIFLTQLLKIPVAFLLRRPTYIGLIASTGGMPSSHSAGVTSLITALIMEYGISSPFVSIAVTFGVIVMFDSMGVRRQSGEHGILINELIHDFEVLRKNLTTMSKKEILELDEEERHSREYLGHKPIEVFFGVISGIIITIIAYHVYYSKI